MKSRQERILEEVRKTFTGPKGEPQELESVEYENINMLTGQIGLPILIRWKTRAGTPRKKRMFLIPPYDPFTGKPQKKEETPQ